MKVLVTGGSGFIGRYCVAQLQAKGYEVHAVSSAVRDAAPGVTWHRANLLAEGEAAALVRRIGATHLLHLAWCTAPGKYWTAPENFDWVRASLAMIQAFTACGGKRFVAAGTCAEYDWSYGVCDEATTPLMPNTLYGGSKQALQTLLSAWSRETGLSSSWGRIFSLYGPHEHPTRLVASAITALLRGEVAQCKNSTLIRDYLHVADVAAAFVALLSSELDGPVNIASGSGVALTTIVEEIGAQIGRLDMLRLEARPMSPSEPLSLVADVARLHSLGWKPHYTLPEGLRQTIDWWRTAEQRICKP